MAATGERQEPLDIDLSPDPVIEAYKPGVDITLLRENLKRTVDQRLDALQSAVAFSVEFRGIARRKSA